MQLEKPSYIFGVIPAQDGIQRVVVIFVRRNPGEVKGIDTDWSLPRA